MREVKVGQVWKWCASNNVEFEVLAVGTDHAYIRFLDDEGFSVSRPLCYWDNDSVLIKDTEELVEEVVQEENNQLSPNVYQFPNGVQVRDISAHLTSFGGQAVQYIARATRLDGVVKGMPVQDLKKAREVIDWEIERMEALNN